MRVLVANDLYGLSSAAGVAVRMARSLAARGHEVSFLATTQKQGAAERFEDGGVSVRIEATPPYALRWRAWRSLDNPAGVAAVGRALDELRPDVLHVHNLHLHLSYAALAEGRRRGIPTVLHVHDIMPVCHTKMFCFLDERLEPGDDVAYRAGPIKCPLCVRFRYNPLRNRAIRRALDRNVTRLVAVSDAMADALTKNGFGPVTTIFNGLAPEEGEVAPEAVSALAERLGVGGRPTVMYGGRLDRLKGGLELVRAMETVRRKHPDAALLCVGETLPGFWQEMTALADRLGMPDVLVATGWLSGDELAAAYRLAHVVVSPSKCFESFGLINAEAMRAGRPVVASFFGGHSDVVREGETGYLVNPLSVATMAARITHLLDEPDLAEAMGAAGRRRVAEHFSLEGQADAVEALYAELPS